MKRVLNINGTKYRRMSKKEYFNLDCSVYHQFRLPDKYVSVVGVNSENFATFVNGKDLLIIFLTPPGHLLFCQVGVIINDDIDKYQQDIIAALELDKIVPR